MAWIEYAVPKPDENTTEITMGDWRVAEGESVRGGDVLCEMVAGKGAFDFIALDDGVLVKRLLAPGSVVPVGYGFALIKTDSESGAQQSINEILDNIERKNRTLLESMASALTAGSSQPEQIRATPAARRLAKEKGVDLSAVKAALGVTGAIKPDDITDYLSR
ncbi:MAG: E3 binding domain-containing protein [Planctomycetota bacterium]